MLDPGSSPSINRSHGVAQPAAGFAPSTHANAKVKARSLAPFCHARPLPAGNQHHPAKCTKNPQTSSQSSKLLYNRRLPDSLPGDRRSTFFYPGLTSTPTDDIYSRETSTSNTRVDFCTSLLHESLLCFVYQKAEVYFALLFPKHPRVQSHPPTPSYPPQQLLPVP
jgi:hypothetical protein